MNKDYLSFGELATMIGLCFVVCIAICLLFVPTKKEEGPQIFEMEGYVVNIDLYFRNTKPSHIDGHGVFTFDIVSKDTVLDPPPLDNWLWQLKFRQKHLYNTEEFHMSYDILNGWDMLNGQVNRWQGNYCVIRYYHDGSDKVVVSLRKPMKINRKIKEINGG